VHDLFVLRTIGDIDGDRLPFLEAKQRARNLLVVGDGLDGVLWGNVEREWGDVQGVIRRTYAMGRFWKGGRSCCHAAELEKAATSEHKLTLPSASLLRNEDEQLVMERGMTRQKTEE
jgi:hypothetical protein